MDIDKIDIDKMEKDMIEEFNNREYIENQLKADIDWSSTGKWVKIKNAGWANTQYEDYDLPKWLIERFNYWTEFYNSYPSETIEKDMNWDQFEAYGISLAVDLKRVLGNEYNVFYGSQTEIAIP